ncbi:MAG: SUMF1/EgtB/PvdO family nonheme iron enzyme [Saprospiraceae bacterium]|nr:SUMF1/EgtB/PvdO family nonheme iron enzyme [Saprospiraceae bacterium]
MLPMLIFPEEPFRIWNLRGMSEALMLLQEKVLTETTEWDVPGTIGAIMRAGGYPKLAYRRRRQAPRYLVLIEQQSPRDHLAGYAAELVKEINHRDLEVAYYFFDKNPARCWKVWRDPLTHVNLELLKSEWNGARLLLLSHASCFINPATGTPSNLALDLPDHFSNVALLATNSPLEWGAAERSLQTLMPVLPMGIEGLGRLMAAWNGEAQLSFGDWQMLLPEPVPTQLSGAAAQRAPAEVFMEVYRYLGKDAFRWLCACAVYPEIYFELTSILHDEAIPPLADLSEWEQHEQWNQAMRLLSRLYWFRRGYLPSTMLDDLKRNLKPADLALVEGEIRRILEISKNRVGETTHAASIRQRMFDWMAEQGFRVLWIDDNPENNQQMIDSWSKSLGILFRQATSTAEAASLLETERFELVISDIGRKGEEHPASATLEMVKRQSPAPPVVFFTDNRGMRLRATLMEAGAYQVTDDIGELQQALSAVWDRKFKPVEEVPPQEQVQEQTAGSMPPESAYQQNVNEPPPLNQAAQDQEMLKKLGYYEGEIDGTPGEQFRSAISRFQRANKLVADGVLGPQTREAMRKAVEELERQGQIADNTVSEKGIVPQVFIAYAREDVELLEELRIHLRPLERTNRVKIWYDGIIEPGIPWENAIKENLYAADIILMLLSSDAIASDYFYEKEMTDALQRHEYREARVVPLIVRPCAWMETPLAKLQALPRNGKPVTSWADRDEAWMNAVESLRHLIDTERKAKVVAEEARLKAETEAAAKRKPEADEEAERQHHHALDSFHHLMLPIEGGSFIMGGTHPVTIKSFHLGKHPVTQAQWRAIMGNDPSHFKGDDLPVEKVSWDDVQDFIQKLNDKTGENYRLPSEAEWEFAARGGTQSKGYEYAGSNLLEEVGWFSYISNSETQPVMQKKANELGLYDMSGNVFEWSPGYLARQFGWFSRRRQRLTSGGGQTSRVNRGGSWLSGRDACRSDFRFWSPANFRNNGTGFRLAQ